MISLLLCWNLSFPLGLRCFVVHKLFSLVDFGACRAFLLYPFNPSAKPFIYEIFVNRDAFWDARIIVSIAVDLMVANELGGKGVEKKS